MVLVLLRVPNPDPYIPALQLSVSRTRRQSFCDAHLSGIVTECLTAGYEWVPPQARKIQTRLRYIVSVAVCTVV